MTDPVNSGNPNPCTVDPVTVGQPINQTAPNDQPCSGQCMDRAIHNARLTAYEHTAILEELEEGEVIEPEELAAIRDDVKRSQAWLEGARALFLRQLDMVNEWLEVNEALARVVGPGDDVEKGEGTLEETGEAEVRKSGGEDEGGESERMEVDGTP